ncbi:MAG: diguanylate cyclase [Alphaproteobacteria bacterium]|nr:diguanylate cyclase [Alphaproteobacteria bacterium]
MEEHHGRGEYAVVNEISTRILTFRYVIALTIMAILALTSHVSFNRVLEEHAGSAYLNRMSSQQQALAQRIAWHASQYAGGVPGARDSLTRTIERFEQTHRQLVREINSGELPQDAVLAIRSVYEGPEDLNARVAEYIRVARGVAASEPGAPGFADAVQTLQQDAEGTLNAGLEHLVEVYDRASTIELQRLHRMQKSLIILVFLTLALEAAIIFQPMVRRIVAYTAELLHLATTDSLTGLLNRRTFMERGFAQVRDARRQGRTSSLLVIDADGFKRINDTFGHAAGDQVLKSMAGALGRRVRKSDILGRVGGEEFALVLPDLRIDAARQMAERLRAEVESLRVESEMGMVTITISIGISIIRFDEDDLHPALARADKALYAAKAAGRNRVEVTDAFPAPASVGSEPAPA